jgi:hypothetical protein
MDKWSAVQRRPYQRRGNSLQNGYGRPEQSQATGLISQARGSLRLHIIQPPKLIEALNDQQAIEEARRIVDGHALEIWDEQRLVIRLEPRKGPEPI